MTVNELHNSFPAAADYLSQIFLIKRDYTRVTNMRLSKRLGVSKPAVTQSIKRLTKLGLAQQDRYGVIELTNAGRIIAKEVLVRHYLIEHVLVDMLGFPWEKSDREAKQLQVIISAELTEHINQKLGNPETCPHGNPFPDSSREKELVEAPRMINALVGSRIKLLRITEEGEELEGLLDFCFRHKLKPGTPLIIHSRDNDRLTVSKGKNAKKIGIPLEYTAHFCFTEKE